MNSEVGLQRERDSPIVACYCATFLKPEMLHIYRQITALSYFRPVILARKIEHREDFCEPEVILLPRSPLRWARRIWQRQIWRQPLTFDWLEVRGLIRVLARIKPALMHVYFGQVAVQLMPALMQWRKAPVVVSFHGADVLVELDQTSYREATRKMLIRADLVLARSASLISAVVALGCPPDKIRLHRTGIPLDDFPYQARDFLGTDGAWHILQACRLIEKKGLAASLRAFATFSAIYPHATFTIAGNGPLLNGLQGLADRLGVAERVRFRGFLTQPELRQELARAHFFLHPSETGADGNQEGVPNSLLEAMATGLPVLGTYHGGIPEAIQHGVSGWLVQEGDSDGLANGLLVLAADPAQMEKLGRNASAVVRAEFDQRRQATTLENYYEEAIRSFSLHG